MKERLLLILPLIVVTLYLIYDNFPKDPESKSLDLKREISEVGTYDSVFMVGLERLPDFTMLSPDFMEFYDQFNTDSTFQQKHVNAPLKGVCFSSCDSTALWEPKTWHFLSWDFRNVMEDNRYNNVLAQSRDKVFFKCEFKDLGILYELGFLHENGSWKLVYCVLNAC